MSSYLEEVESIMMAMGDKEITMTEASEQLKKLRSKYPKEETTPKCNACNSYRLLTISGHCVDSFSAKYVDSDLETLKYDGYVPEGLNIGGGDDVELCICMECGKVQDLFPVSDEKVKMWGLG
jgi:hypothetical protein